MISLVSLISKGMWNNKDEIADTFFLRHCSKRSWQGCHIFHEKTRAGRKFQPKWPHELFTTEIPWKPFLTCQDDDEMVTHVASARSDAKSKKKKKAIDRFCFVSNGRGIFFSSSECLRVQSLALGVGDSSWRCLVFGGIFELNAPKIAIFIQTSYQSDEWLWCWIDLDR